MSMHPVQRQDIRTAISQIETVLPNLEANPNLYPELSKGGAGEHLLTLALQNLRAVLDWDKSSRQTRRYIIPLKHQSRWLGFYVTVYRDRSVESGKVMRSLVPPGRFIQDETLLPDAARRKAAAQMLWLARDMGIGITTEYL